MKKYFSMFAVVLLIICMLTVMIGCGGPSSGGENEEPVESASTGSIASTVNIPSPQKIPGFEPTVIVDNEYCSFTIKWVEDEPGCDYFELWVDIENKTDAELEVHISNGSINGVEYPAGGFQRVDAGMKEETVFVIGPNTYGEQKIQPTSFGFQLEAYDPDPSQWGVDFVNDTFLYEANK